MDKTPQWLPQAPQNLPRTQQVLAIIVDFQSTSEAAELSIQLAHSGSAQNSNPGAKNSFQLKIIHLDNGNSPPVKLSQAQIEKGVELLSTGRNLGYAGALNFAVAHHKTSTPENSNTAYWFLNSDLEIPSDCLPKLVGVLNSHPEVGAIGPIVRDSFRHEKVWGARGVVSPVLGTTAMTDWKQGGVLPKWSYLPGCSLLVRAAAYEEVGKLPENYKLYFEETEFCIRMQRTQWKLWVDPTADVYHKVHSMKGRIPARHFAYYFTRNNLVFWKTCFGIPVWLQFPRTLYVVFREVLLPLRRAKNWADVIDRLQYTWGGLVDGVLLAMSCRLRFERKLFPESPHGP